MRTLWADYSIYCKETRLHLALAWTRRYELRQSGHIHLTILVRLNRCCARIRLPGRTDIRAHDGSVFGYPNRMAAALNITTERNGFGPL